MEKLTMTHNQYYNFLKTSADRVLTDKNYTISNYLEDCDGIEVIPFDLSVYNLPKDIENVINNILTEETTNRNGHYMLKAFIADSDYLLYQIKEKLKFEKIIGNYYSGYCYNDELKMILTHNEGDLFLLLFASDVDYKRELQETIKWYEEN